MRAVARQFNRIKCVRVCFCVCLFRRVQSYRRHTLADDNVNVADERFLFRLVCAGVMVWYSVDGFSHNKEQVISVCDCSARRESTETVGRTKFADAINQLVSTEQKCVRQNVRNVSASLVEEVSARTCVCKSPFYSWWSNCAKRFFVHFIRVHTPGKYSIWIQIEYKFITTFHRLVSDQWMVCWKKGKTKAPTTAETKVAASSADRSSDCSVAT